MKTTTRNFWNAVILVAAMLSWFNITNAQTNNSCPPRIITDFHNHPTEVAEKLWNGLVGSVSLIKNYYTNPEYATQVNIAIILWWQDNVTEEHINAVWGRYQTDPIYRRDVEDGIMEQLTYFVIFHYAGTQLARLSEITPKISMSVSAEQKMTLTTAGFSMSKNIKYTIGGVKAILTSGSRKFGLKHILEHTETWINSMGKTGHYKTLFIKSDPEYILNQLNKFVHTERLTHTFENGVHIFKGTVATPYGVNRTYALIVEKSGFIKTFYPVYDIKPGVLNKAIFSDFYRAQALKKPYLINYGK